MIFKFFLVHIIKNKTLLIAIKDSLLPSTIYLRLV